MNVSMKKKQAHRFREEICDCQGGGALRQGRMGVRDQQMRTVIYITDKQQGPTIQHRELIQYPVINHNGKEYEKDLKEYERICLKEYEKEKKNTSVYN